MTMDLVQNGQGVNGRTLGQCSILTQNFMIIDQEKLEPIFIPGTPCLPDHTSRLSNNPNSEEQANGLLLVVD